MIKISKIDQRIEALFSDPGKQGVSAWKWVLPPVLVLILGMNLCVTCRGQGESVEQESVEIRFEPNADGRLTFVVRHLEDSGTAVIKVWVEGANQQTDPPLSGTSTVEQNRLIFEPRFPLVNGSRYNVVVQTKTKTKAKPIRATLNLPSEGQAVSRVTDVYPSSDELPENTLKFYIHFSEPMRKGDVYRYFRLREAGGEDVELPFLEIEQEFWSRDSKRLTLLLDPGRIKRGLKPREDMGPILTAGRTYELVIDGSWPDSNGKQLGKDYVKRFRALKEDHVQPDPAGWKIWLPKTGTSNPLIIRFTESLDHSMLFGSIVIRDEASNVIEGTISVTDREKRWTFEPLNPWLAGSFKILINAALEDNAGNSVGRQFDVDVFEKTEPSDSLPVIQWHFEINE